jgi:hypothetical protein
VDADAARLIYVDTSDILAADIAPPQYVIEPLLPRGHVTLLGAHGGSGKSMLALSLCGLVAGGATFAGLNVAHGRALYASLEDSGELTRYRLRRIIETYGLNPAITTAHLTLLDGSAGEALLAHEQMSGGVRKLYCTDLYESLRKAAHGYDLIVIDNASDAFGGNENDRAQVRRFIRFLGWIARENNAAVCLLAHIDKTAARFGSAGNSYSGSTAWHNSVRSRLALINTDGAIELRQEKLNLGRKAEPISLSWSDSGVLVPGAGSEGGNGAALRDKADNQAVLAAIAAATASGENVPTARTGPATMLHVLGTVPGFPPHFRKGKAGKDRFWAAVFRLQQSGDIARETYTTGSRNTRERWICVGSDVCVDSPIPPALTNARVGVSCAGFVSSRELTKLTKLTQQRQCPHCGGEGCGWCTPEAAA